MIFLSIIIPAKNESKRLPLTIVDLDKKLKSFDFSYEVIVVDNKSSDSTSKVMERFSTMMPYLKLMEGDGLGKGSAVKAGMLEAKGVYRLFLDADNSTSVDQFEKMLPYFKEGYDVVIGSRYVDGAVMDPPQPFYKRVLGRAGNLIIRIFLLPGFKDTQCGFKCFKSEAASHVFERSSIGGWGFDAEAIVLAIRAGFRVKEMPIIWKDDSETKVSFFDYFRVLGETVLIRFRLWTGYYK